MPGATSDTLRSRTYIGLIVAQFTNGFNDQAAHIIGNFFACDMLIGYARLQGVDEKLLVAVVTLCFIAPLLLFSPFAGILADKKSKRNIIVTMKCFEASFMLLGLIAMLLPKLSHFLPDHSRTLGITSAALMILVVFLMGLQTAFLVPAKYGIMPEILSPSVLSKGNGVLEGTTFVAQLAGTSFGGILYSLLKHPSDLQTGFRDSNAWIAPAVLLLLAVIGLVAALAMGPVPAAAPNRKMTYNWFAPLRESFRVLAKSRPLALAVVGIAFAAFMTLYSRQSLLYEGETRKQLDLARVAYAEKLDQQRPGDPAAAQDLIGLEHEGMSESQKSELRVSMLIAMVGLGIGIGSLLAGHLSGSKLELGLVPIGGVALAFVTATLAFVLQIPWALFLCLVLVGLCAGLYVVPLYTMLQHRAPKEQKGNIVAASNFVNVAGGVIAIATFYFVTFIGERTLGSLPEPIQAQASVEELKQYLDMLESRLWIPKLLFATASVMTVGMLLFICRFLPDFFTRALIYLFSYRRYHLRVEGLHHLPQDGPAILATNSALFDSCVHVLGATDRYVHFYLPEREGSNPKGILGLIAKLSSATTVPRAGNRQEAMESALATIRQGDMIGVAIESVEDSAGIWSFFQAVQQQAGVPIVPVFTDVHQPERHGRTRESHRRWARVVFGPAMPSQSDPHEVREALAQIDRRTIMPPVAS
jgi:acyl-[acyl-carrier-protein]-phospholipid O-acyltransferase/long-chain-fatty-acid--[acyl-carrier-protein] ligase